LLNFPTCGSSENSTFVDLAPNTSGSVYPAATSTYAYILCDTTYQCGFAAEPQCVAENSTCVDLNCCAYARAES